VRVVAQPLIAVADVEASRRLYPHLLGAYGRHGIWLRNPDGYLVVLASRPAGLGAAGL
jgi:hypothetical protein